jgi:hypothetical protein
MAALAAAALVYLAGCVAAYRGLVRAADRLRAADNLRAACGSAPASSVPVNRRAPVPGVPTCADETEALDGVAGPDFGVPRPDHFHAGV